MWILWLACSSSPMEPCTTTGVWDLSTDEANPSIEWALSHGAEDICLGPGAYALPCGDFDQQPLRITGAGAEQTELRGASCNQRYFNGAGDYLLQDLSITTDTLFIQPSSGRVEIRDVVIRDLGEPQTSTAGVILWGLVDIDGLEIRDAVLPNGYLTIVGQGSTVRDLWVHDNTQYEHHTMEFTGVAFEDLRVEDNIQGELASGNTFMQLSDAQVDGLHFANNGTGELLVDGQVSLSETLFQDSAGEDGQVIQTLSDTTLRVDAADFSRSGGISMARDSTLLLSDTDFQGLDCPVLCSEACLEPAAEVNCL